MDETGDRGIAKTSTRKIKTTKNYRTVSGKEYGAKSGGAAACPRSSLNKPEVSFSTSEAAVPGDGCFAVAGGGRSE
jgi:hypothetical protein